MLGLRARIDTFQNRKTLLPFLAGLGFFFRRPDTARLVPAGRIGLTGKNPLVYRWSGKAYLEKKKNGCGGFPHFVGLPFARFARVLSA